MMEMRWLTWEEEENIIPPVSQIQFGKPFDKHMVTKRKLQYRQKVDVAVRAAAAGMWDNESLMQTADWQWSAWRDVPLESERNPDYP